MADTAQPSASTEAADLHPWHHASPAGSLVPSAWTPRADLRPGQVAAITGATAKTFWAFCRAFELGEPAAVDAIAAAAIERGLTPRAVRAQRSGPPSTIRSGALRPKARGGREAGLHDH